MPIIAKIMIAEQKMKHLLQHKIMTNTRIRQELLILMRNVANNNTVLGTLQVKCTGI
jgi:hypothetical protein